MIRSKTKQGVLQLFYKDKEKDKRNNDSHLLVSLPISPLTFGSQPYGHCSHLVVEQPVCSKLPSCLEADKSLFRFG